MKPPPAKPFAIAFITCLVIFIAWAIIGSILEPAVTDVAAHERIARVAMPIALALFLIMGFSAIPVMVRVFFKLFFGMQRAVGGADQPAVQKLQANWETLAALFVYGVWILFALGSLIGLPFFIHDMMSGS